jgi:hypothetical protein
MVLSIDLCGSSRAACWLSGMISIGPTPAQLGRLAQRPTGVTAVDADLDARGAARAQHGDQDQAWFLHDRAGQQAAGNGLRVDRAEGGHVRKR